jgi:hypothetical protein
MRDLRRALVAIFLAAGCTAPIPVPTNPALARCQVNLGRRLPNRYQIGAVDTTPLGLQVDFSGQAVDPLEIDRRALAVAQCLGLAAVPSCPVIKLAPDPIRSCYQPYELLPIAAPPDGCRAKKQEVTEACPCNWRVGVQLDGLVVTTPDLNNFGDPLVRVWTGTDEIWADARLSACAMKGAGALAP